MKKLYILTAITTIFLILSRCYIDEYENIEDIRVESFSPTFGFPVVNSTISLTDLLENAGSGSFIEVRNDSIILGFSENMSFELDINTFNVPDKDFSFTVPITGQSFDLFQEDYNTIGNDSEIKRIDLKGGSLWIEFEGNLTGETGEIYAELQIQSLKTTDQPEGLKVFYNWSEGAAISIHSFDLAGTWLDLFKIDGTDTIYNSISYGLGLASSGGVSGNLLVRFGFSSIEFEKITGKIFHEVEIPPREISLDVFSSVIDGKIYLKNPSIKFNIGTSFGTPSSVRIDEIKFENYANEIRLLENTGVPHEDDFLLGEKNFLPFGTEEAPYATKLFKLDGVNSNLDQILPFSPNKISLSGSFALGDTDQSLHDPYDSYVSDTSSFSIDLELEIPLSGRIENLRFSQLISGLSWPEIDSVEILDDFSITLLLKTINGLPLTLGFQAEFLDYNDNVLASLFDSDGDMENIIESPDIDASGNPAAGTFREKLIRVGLSREKYETIASTSKAEFIFAVDTGIEGSSDVNFKASQTLGIQISVEISVRTNPVIHGSR